MNKFNDLKVGDQVAVSVHTSAYDGKYTGVVGRVVQCYKRNSTGEKMYGVRLDGHHNSMSGFNDLFWFREDELVRFFDRDSIDAFVNSLKTMDSIREAAKMTNPNPKPSLVEKVIVNGPKTIVFWNDGTKTIVSCREGEEFDIYTAFCAALAKKMFGSTSRVKAILEDKLIIQEKKDKKKPDDLSGQTNCSLDTLLQKELVNSIEELKRRLLEVFNHD